MSRFLLPILLCSIHLLAFAQFPNPNFANNGMFEYNTGGKTWSSGLDQTGTSLLIGAQDDLGRFALIKTDKQGNMDPQFGQSGVSYYDRFGNEEIKDLTSNQTHHFALSTNSGAAGRFDGFLAKMDQFGNLDPNYATEGIHYFAYMQAKAVVALDDGTILVAGNKQAPADPIFLTSLTRLTPSGELDQSFGLDFQVDWGESKTANIIAGNDGSFYITGVLNRDFMVARFTADGQFDPDFGIGGICLVETLPQRVGTSYDLLVLDDGSLVACGIQTGSGDDIATVFKLTPDGIIDSTFGNNGIVLEETIMDQSHTGFQSVQLSGEEAIVILGTAGGTPFLASYDLHGGRNTSFGEGGVYVPSVPGSDLRSTHLVVEGTGLYFNVTGNSYNNATVVALETEQMTTSLDNRYQLESQVYPNQIHDLGELKIIIPPGHDQYVTFELYNQMGQALRSGIVDSDPLTGNLPSGFYLLRLSKGNKYATYKILMQ